ncbi:2-oxoglutarate (2OG) and Fe(II)-dependent oxygenase superfamily protein [Abeliophyllum distichum]|uniref:2-oxoglutarate (2OG) and Fe(II)-dependent oxygenase superfamily protein n=1 Tax=Abeliophyllum distichum TaxID=126358 RepID=A0ABD1QLG2_9LAMI
MVRQTDHSTTVTLSSIALLQERFRQLEKMKEMRQEKALLRMLSVSESRYSPPTMNYEPVYKSFSSELMMFAPRKPDCQLSLSLFPDTQIKSPSFRGAEVPRDTIFIDKPSACSSSIKIDNSDSDIDTSLHL